MKKSDFFKQKRAEASDKLKQLRALENMTDAQKAEARGLLEEIKAHGADIEMRLALEAEAAEAATRQAEAAGLSARTEADPAGKKPKGKQGGEARARVELMQRASISTGIRNLMKGVKNEGAEAELEQEGRSEAQALSRSIEGFAIPSFMMGGQEARDMTVGNDPAAGTTVNVTESGLIPYLYPTTILSQLGATVMTGMTGNFDLIKQNGGTEAFWEGEIDENEETNATYERKPLRPKRLGAKTVYSKQLLLQSSLAVEQEVRRNLNTAVGIALERAALNGSGAGNVPLGLLNQPGINVVEVGADGGAVTRSMLLELEEVVANANAAMNTPSFLATPGMRRYLKDLQVDAGSAAFVWNDNNNIIGYNGNISNLLPKDLAKGTGTNLHALILGAFQELYIAQWGGLDIVLDPYTKASTAQCRVIVNSWWDINTRHPEAFAVIKDANPNA